MEETLGRVMDIITPHSPYLRNCHIQKKDSNHMAAVQFGESAGVRTRDPNIKSVVLYLLSYGFSEVPLLSRLVVQR